MIVPVAVEARTLGIDLIDHTTSLCVGATYVGTHKAACGTCGPADMEFDGDGITSQRDAPLVGSWGLCQYNFTCRHDIPVW